MGDSPARIRAYVRTRTRTHAGHASRHKIDPPDRRLATISVVELRQIVFMKVNRCSSLAVIAATRSFPRVSVRTRRSSRHVALSSLDQSIDKSRETKILTRYRSFKTSSSESIHDINYLLIIYIMYRFARKIFNNFFNNFLLIIF